MLGLTKNGHYVIKIFPNTDTNMFVESFNNKPKTFYMNCRPSKRFDDLLILLLVTDEDNY